MQNSSDSRITGVLSPVVTPFKADLSPDADRLVSHCRWLLSNDVGLAVFGNEFRSKFAFRRREDRAPRSRGWCGRESSPDDAGHGLLRDY